ncbi:MAG: PD40 domain-containing protein [Planctomycetaceae bacterium]|nr:PD40 domain-containing protein [Planctomycetaceae bacterium]
MSPRILLITSLLTLLISAGTLSAQEPPPDELKLQTWPQLYITDPDGANMTKLFPERTGRAEESVDFSEDGRLMVFSGYNAEAGERNTSSKIYWYNLETEEERELTAGAMPSLSPRGKRIFFSRYDSRGVWVANLDQIEETKYLLDDRGWGCAWSPDGKKLAWASYAHGYNIKILDIVEGEEWAVFEDDPTPFRIIYYHFAWSPDSRNLVFLAEDRARTKGLFAVEVLDERQPVKLLEDREIHHTIAWHPDGSKILFASRDEETKLYRLMTMEPLHREKEPVLLDRIPAGISAFAPRYTPDGKKIIFSAYAPKEPEKPKP